MLALLAGVSRSGFPAEADEWRTWRGPNLNGVATAGQTPPTEWSETKNIVWTVPVPGRGHSSPTLVGDRIFLTSADESSQTQAVICFDRKTGQQLWLTPVNRGGFPAQIHNKNTHASPTAVSDGERVYASFLNHDGVQLVALSLEGKILWPKKQSSVGAYLPKQYRYGYAPSPLLYDGTVIVASESDSGSFLAAFNAKTGREVWRTPRPNRISYSSPVVGRVAGRDQLLISGSELVSSYDPKTGKPLWATPGTASATCGTMIWEGDLVFASGGYPTKETICVKGDGSRTVMWRNQEKCYEQSMLVHDGYVYAVNDGGIAFCWKADTGREMWKSRLAGPVSSSPVLANGNIYISNERGTTFVFKATPEQFVAVAQNQLGDEAFASPAIVDSRIYLRVASSSRGGRQETLYCIGQ
ncbi:PQQ-binding-like beta-propeller repeat protein [bacterium]|nr:PQQ-binding-like beta-propeller repeat protein [bacterium]